MRSAAVGDGHHYVQGATPAKGDEPARPSRSCKDDSNATCYHRAELLKLHGLPGHDTKKQRKPARPGIPILSGILS